MRRRLASPALVRILTAAIGIATLLTSADARAADRPYVTLHDDGTLAGSVTSPDTVRRAVMKTYQTSGQSVPDVISLWTSFDMDKNAIETLFVPASNQVTGLGLENEYGGDGTFGSEYGPLQDILLHNNVTKLDARAAVQAAPVEGFGEYLFLLEFSHAWGPAIRLPTTDGPDDALIGFPFHWSFWMDAGGSPAGGNAWKDNGDGSFTVSGQKPSTVNYSMLDLYLMGLASPNEVPPFGVLVDAVPPADVLDPFSHQKLGKASFPWFGSEPLTVTGAKRRVVTIDDVIATNGARSPNAANAKNSWSLGIVLMVSKDAEDAEIAPAEAAMDVLAPKLAPAFVAATRGRGAMSVVTSSPSPETPAPPGPVPTTTPPPADEEEAAPPATTTTRTSGCGIARANGGTAPSMFALLIGGALVGLRTLRKRGVRAA
jgi:hypothetical protein